MRLQLQLPPTPKLSKGDVQKHLAMLKAWKEALDLEIQKYNGVLRALAPETARAPKNRLIGYVKPYLYPLTGATEEQIVKHMIDSGFMLEFEIHRLRQALSTCVTMGSLIRKNNRYCLSNGERGKMAAAPGAYKLSTDTARKFADLKAD